MPAMIRLTRKAQFQIHKSDAERATFSGLGSVFGNVDGGGDIVEHGAFAKSLSERKPKLLLQHGFSEIGVIPAGKFTTVKETAQGLEVAGELFLENDLLRLTHRGMKEGELDGLSIGYVPKRWEWDATSEVRLLKEVDLYEVSIVTWPMNEAATITAVKRLADGGTLTERELEGILRDAGLSKSQAKRVVSQGHRGLIRPDAGLHPEAGIENLTTFLHNIREDIRNGH